MEKRIINVDPELMNGTPVFMGSRVPITALFFYLEAGDSLDDFLEDFPSVRRELAVALCQLAAKAIRTSTSVRHENLARRKHAQAA